MAWEAYQAMGKSKAEYFTFLQDIDQKYKQNGSPTIEENNRLEELLKVHDEKVSAFNDTMQSIEDTDARELLLKKLPADATLGAH
ncbi:MAG: hypothetical protein V3V89_02280 [Gammaproteobacteria bacterium]